MQRPYTKAQDFNDLPQALLFVWKSTHVLKNSKFATFEDPLSRQILTVDSIKAILEQSLLDLGCSLSDFCFNLTCRLCLRNFKKLKLDPALLAYLTHVVAKIQNSTAAVHSSIEEAKLLGKFPLPSEETLDACLQFFSKRPRITERPLLHQVSSSLQLHVGPASSHPLDRLQENTRRVAPSYHHQRPQDAAQDLCPPRAYLPAQDEDYGSDHFDYDAPHLEPANACLQTPFTDTRPLLSAPPGMSVKRQRDF